MVSPMREKRVWPPVSREVDAAESVAQFEATVAVAKQTVAKSGEMLVSVKEDLSDHKRWLQMQAAAAEADRVRHERWLQRQHERRQTEARREETRERRRAFRRRVFGRIEYAGLSVLIAIVGAWTSFANAVKGGFRFVVGSIGAGFGWIGHGIGSAFGAVGRQAGFAVQWSTAKSRQVAAAAGEASALAFGRVGTGAGHLASVAVEKAKNAGIQLSVKVKETAPILGAQLSAGHAAIAAQARDASGLLQRSLGNTFSTLSAKVQTTAPILSERFAAVSAGMSARAAGISGSARQMLGSGLATASAKLRGAAPALHAALGDAAAKAQGLAQSAVAGTQGLLDKAKSPEDAAVKEAEEPDEAINWLFDDADRGLAARSVFTVEEVPGGLRLEGFSFTGENRLDLPLTDLSASIKPDLKLTDLKLVLHVAEPDEAAGAPRTGGTVVPPRSLFRLAAAFPPEAMEEEAGELVASYGGLMLKVTYRIGEEERSFTRYIAPAFLNAQLSEIPDSDEPPIARF